MSELIVYANRCLKCKWKSELRTITRWAGENGYNITTKRTDLDAEARAEADTLLTDPPFVYSPTSGKTIRLVGISTSEMDWLL